MKVRKVKAEIKKIAKKLDKNDKEVLKEAYEYLKAFELIQKHEINCSRKMYGLANAEHYNSYLGMAQSTNRRLTNKVFFFVKNMLNKED